MDDRETIKLLFSTGEYSFIEDKNLSDYEIWKMFFLYSYLYSHEEIRNDLKLTSKEDIKEFMNSMRENLEDRNE